MPPDSLVLAKRAFGVERFHRFDEALAGHACGHVRPFGCLNEFVRHLFKFTLVYLNIVEADGETYRAVELHYALDLAVVLLKLEQAEHAERNDFTV